MSMVEVAPNFNNRGNDISIGSSMNGYTWKMVHNPQNEVINTELVAHPYDDAEVEVVSRTELEQQRVEHDQQFELSEIAAGGLVIALDEHRLPTGVDSARQIA